MAFLMLMARSVRSFAPRTANVVRATSFARTAPPMSRMFSEAVSSEGKKSGLVKWFNTVKGYGFVTPNGGGADVFVHQTQIYARGFRSLAEGEEVEFDVEIDPNGRERAVSVTGPDGDYVQGAPRPEPRYDNMDDGY